MQHQPQDLISNILGQRNTSRSITRRGLKPTTQFELAEIEGNEEVRQALMRKYPRSAARRYVTDAVQTAIDLVSEEGFPDKDKVEVLRGLLAGLANPQKRTFWLLLIFGLSRDKRLAKVGRCRVCNKFFAAVRKDQKCCSRKCANAFRVRRWRKQYPEVYKLRRIQSEIARDNGKKGGRPPKNPKRGHQ